MRKRILAYLATAIAVIVIPAARADMQPAPALAASSQASLADSVEGLPEYSQALDFVRSAQAVYVFSNTNPRFPHRDDKHMRLLDAQARAALIGMLDAKDDWWQGLYELGVPDKPDTDVGFVFKTGKDEMVLFFLDDSMASGTLNGQSFKGLLNQDLSRKLKDWATKYAKAELAVPAETPPVERVPSNITVIDGIVFSGDDLDKTSNSDLHGALTALKDAGLSRPETVILMDKDNTRGYLDGDAWMTAIRTDCADPGLGHSCWKVPVHRLPTYAEAMRCIMGARYVHVFPVANPLKHYRDFDRSQMLDDQSRRDLVGLLGSADSWSEVPDSAMPLPGGLPADFGFAIGDGKRWVHLFFSSDGRVQGDFNGEYLSGTLDKKVAQELQAWKAKYIKSWVVGADQVLSGR